MHNIYKYLAMAMLVCLTVWHLPILGAKPRMVCPDGKRPYFGVCPGGEEPIPSDGAASEARNHSRPQPESKPQVDVRPVGHIDSADGCNASRRPGGGKSDCPPKKVVTPTVVTTTPTAALIAGRYQDNGDGTVTDVTTNLMWKQCSEGLTWVSGTCSGYNAVEITSNEAMPNSQQKIWLNFYGYDDPD